MQVLGIENNIHNRALVFQMMQKDLTKAQETPLPGDQALGKQARELLGSFIHKMEDTCKSSNVSPSSDNEKEESSNNFTEVDFEDLGKD